MFCSLCGHTIAEGARFCPSCGLDLTATTPGARVDGAAAARLMTDSSGSPPATRRGAMARSDGSIEPAAARLFAALRRLDAMGLDRILAEPCEEPGLGYAIMDRLRRAAGRDG